MTKHAILVTGCHRELRAEDTRPVIHRVLEHRRSAVETARVEEWAASCKSEGLDIIAILHRSSPAYPQFTVIEGGATGVDTWAGDLADYLGFKRETYPMAVFYPTCKACNGRGNFMFTDPLASPLSICRTCKGHGKIFARYAGPKRNRHMVKRALEFDTQECIGVWDYTSRGTWGCMKEATSAGIPLTLVDMGEPTSPVITSFHDRPQEDVYKFLVDHEPKSRRAPRH